MMRALSSAVLFIVLLAMTAVPATAFPEQYTVEPAFGATGIAVPDIVPITFWDLTLREMVIVIALAISPLLLAPVEIVFTIKLLSVLGFRRIVRGNILGNSVRNTLYCCIRERPGISPGELAEAAGLSRGALAYHLALLRAFGKIVLVKNHGGVRCFENSGTYSLCEQKMFNCLRSGTGNKIIRALAATPGLSREELGQVLGVSGPTVTWHMKRLAADGVVDVSRDGRFSRYAISEEMTAFLQRTGDDGSISGMSPTGEGSHTVLSAAAGSADG
ncbi:winged helix-turn-helix transcriptional regulator [Methanoregula sp.]|uniref:winged helix-turn-helix transcriptional regulator n=1 Tax=Methanoregula sp. TaxID=2052170 RepID=UPI0023746ED9|nr:winged helix-turn-helix transcriptional regulator [Methanoregula sp.]MDD1686123.1 winged helix-turn-helix transcriptional regulator [Methanoregula sp.]